MPTFLKSKLGLAAPVSLDSGMFVEQVLVGGCFSKGAPIFGARPLGDSLFSFLRKPAGDPGLVLRTCRLYLFVSRGSATLR